MTAHVSPVLDHAIRTGAWQLKPPGRVRTLKPGRLVRIACYQRYGLNRAAQALGLAKTTLEQWLRDNGVPLVGKGNRTGKSQRVQVRPARCTWRRKSVIGHPDTERIYLPGRR